MDSDPLEIPVQPIPFEHGLVHFSQSLTDGQSKVVAIGSSTTAGEGNIVPYPGRLLQFLQSDREKTEADIILMDLQYVPAILTRAKREKALAMVEAIGRLALEAGVNVFRRFAFMKSLLDVEGFPLDRMVDPLDNDRLHCSEWVTGRVAWALRIAIADGVKLARASVTARR